MIYVILAVYHTLYNVYIAVFNKKKANSKMQKDVDLQRGSSQGRVKQALCVGTVERLRPTGFSAKIWNQGSSTST